MKRKLYILLLAVAAFFAGSASSFAQSPAPQAIEFNKKVHNFGKISVNDGARHCSFEFRNTSDKPVVINNIISSCGCTEPVWPKKPIMPGESGKVEVTYLNDQGPYPFDKALTVYTSASTKPIILRITGLAYENERSLKEMFPASIGVLGVKKEIVRGGQIAQGNSKSGNFQIANISNKSVTVKFADITPGLEISVEPQTIPAGEVAEVTYTIKSANSVTFTAGSVPGNSTATFENTNTTDNGQELTEGNSMTLTLSGFDGCTITGLTLSMKSEKKNSTGSLSMNVGSVTEELITNSKNIKEEYFSLYIELFNKIKNTVPNVAITTDIIVGFPGETDEDFEICYNFAKQMQFANTHLFRYSPRPGTVAAEYKD